MKWRKSVAERMEKNLCREYVEETSPESRMDTITVRWERNHSRELREPTSKGAVSFHIDENRIDECRLSECA